MLFILVFLSRATGSKSIDMSKYGPSKLWDVKDLEQSILLLQYGLRHCYKERQKFLEHKRKLKNEIDDLLQ